MCKHLFYFDLNSFLLSICIYSPMYMCVYTCVCFISKHTHSFSLCLTHTHTHTHTHAHTHTHSWLYDCAAEEPHHLLSVETQKIQWWSLKDREPMMWPCELGNRRLQGQGFSNLLELIKDSLFPGCWTGDYSVRLLLCWVLVFSGSISLFYGNV